MTEIHECPACGETHYGTISEPTKCNATAASQPADEADAEANNHRGQAAQGPEGGMTADQQRDALAKFWTFFLSETSAWTTEIDAERMWDKAVELGLAEYVAYDPEKHTEFDPENVDFEEGDMIYRLTERGKALRA